MAWVASLGCSVRARQLEPVAEWQRASRLIKHVLFPRGTDAIGYPLPFPEAQPYKPSPLYGALMGLNRVFQVRDGRSGYSGVATQTPLSFSLTLTLALALASSLYYCLIQDVFKANPSFKTWILKIQTGPE